ncbi:hypothetical protein CRUP_008011 [Coryphaenoides rupestris]|nr:hypothetical protein CRUP_008011 [Coryphaenoides rupestris]
MAGFARAVSEDGGVGGGAAAWGDSRPVTRLFPRPGSSRGSGVPGTGRVVQSLARTKIRSYGSTASVAASLGEKFVEHRVADSDTLQGIALKYGVTMEQVKRANKLFGNDCIFLRASLSIPVLSEKRYQFNGLSLDSPDPPSGEAPPPHGGDEPGGTEGAGEGPSPAPSPPLDSGAPEPPQPRPQPEELSAKDFLHRLDLQIKQSKQAARRLKEEEVRDSEEEDFTVTTTAYQEI